MKGVASDLAGCLKWKEAAYLMFEDGTDTVRRVTAVVTLGSDVDLLQERYQNTGRMLESYMLESIGGELLMLGYGMLEAWIRENTGYQVAAYHFFGDDEAHPAVCDAGDLSAGKTAQGRLYGRVLPETEEKRGV